MSDTSLPDEWEQVKIEWHKTNQLGYEAVMQAAKVGRILMDLKTKSKHGEFKKKVNHAALFEYRTAANLMKLADNLPLLEEQKPESQRAALKLIREANPKATTATKKIVLRLKQADFDLIRECLETEDVPDELQDRFAKALEIINHRITAQV